MKTVEPRSPVAARAAVAPMRDRLRLDEQLAPYRDLTWSGAHCQLPTLSLDDVSAIPFLDGISGVEQYQHRARLRARTGDLFAAATPRTAGYESYCREHLGLGRVEFIHAQPEENPLEVARACSRGKRLTRLVEATREAGGLIIHPYMGVDSVWALGDRIAEASDRPVVVIAPPPPVTWIANDKSTFSEVVTRVLGPDWLVETFEAESPARLALHLLDLASRHDRVALKRLRCASAMGNEVFDSRELRAQGLAEALRLVEAFLARTRWDGDESIQAVAWEDTDLSPSTQLWIPPDGQGPPVVDGVYEQLLEGEHGVFIGSRPSSLPPLANRALGAASLEIGYALQALGYVGRCSFDFLLVGDPVGDFALRFTECNGRWGGTSIPMALLDRLVDGPRPPYRAQDFVRPDLVGVAFDEVLRACASDIYEPETGHGHFIFYNVGPLASVGKLDVIALGRDLDEADEMMLERLPRLLGV